MTLDYILDWAILIVGAAIIALVIPPKIMPKKWGIRKGPLFPLNNHKEDEDELDDN